MLLSRQSSIRVRPEWGKGSVRVLWGGLETAGDGAKGTGGGVVAKSEPSRLDRPSNKGQGGARV